MPAKQLFWVRQRISGLYRIPFEGPCHLEGVAGLRAAKICDLSPGGVYIAVEPMPAVGESLTISFALPGREIPLTVKSVVTWRNAFWDSRVWDLPPGCGLRFLGLSPQDGQQIHALVRSQMLPWSTAH